MKDLDPAVDASALLMDHASGDSRATSQLLPLVYHRLRRLAAHYMKGERPGHTLQPTALVHEAYLRLIDGDRVDWHGKIHFFAVAAVAAGAMRRVFEMRFFSGLRIGEISSLLSVSERTVKRDWTVARTWLACELCRCTPAEPP